MGTNRIMSPLMVSYSIYLILFKSERQELLFQLETRGCLRPASRPCIERRKKDLLHYCQDAMPPLQGLGVFSRFIPKALPWAGIYQPFRLIAPPAKFMNGTRGRCWGATFRTGRRIFEFSISPKSSLLLPCRGLIIRG